MYLPWSNVKQIYYEWILWNTTYIQNNNSDRRSRRMRCRANGDFLTSWRVKPSLSGIYKSGFPVFMVRNFFLNFIPGFNALPFPCSGETRTFDMKMKWIVRAITICSALKLYFIVIVRPLNKTVGFANVRFTTNSYTHTSSGAPGEFSRNGYLNNSHWPPNRRHLFYSRSTNRAFSYNSEIILINTFKQC